MKLGHEPSILETNARSSCGKVAIAFGSGCRNEVHFIIAPIFQQLFCVYAGIRWAGRSTESNKSNRVQWQQSMWQKQFLPRGIFHQRKTSTLRAAVIHHFYFGIFHIFRRTVAFAGWFFAFSSKHKYSVYMLYA